MNGRDPLQLDTRSVRRNFSRASDSYDAAAQLQTSVRNELIERSRFLLQGHATRIERILDLGAGTGAALPGLHAAWPDAQLLAIDVAAPMLVRAMTRLPPAPPSVSTWKRLLGSWRSGSSAMPHSRGTCAALCADASRLPVTNAAIDVVFSNLMLQWCDDLDVALNEIRRVLKPGGLLTFSTFGPDTLHELRSAWAQVDERPHVSRFIDMHDIGDALLRAGFSEPVLDVDRLRTTHDDPRALMRHLQDIGARNATAGRGTALTGRRRFAAACAAYPREPGRSDIVASWEVVYASAFAGDAANVRGE